MFIYKNNSGVQLTVEEFIEILENDLLDDFIELITFLDLTDVDELIESYMEEEESEDDRMNRLMKRLPKEDIE